MAEADYQRLAAACACGAVFTKKKPAHVSCSRRCSRLARDGAPLPLLALRCECCGAAFTSSTPGAKFCGGACRLATWRAANPDRVRAQQQKDAQRQALKPKPDRPPAALHQLTCTECAAGFTSQVFSQKRCGAACNAAHAKREANKSAQLQHRAAGRVLQCSACACSYCPLYGAKPGARPLCQVCGIEARRRWRREKGGNGPQRAKRYGVPRLHFNPRRVLERDGWRCQLCGVETPEALRGTTDPRAPEVDHRVPLSAGGPHTEDNCQCACRRCNGLKGADAGWLPPRADRGSQAVLT